MQFRCIMHSDENRAPMLQGRPIADGPIRSKTKKNDMQDNKVTNVRGRTMWKDEEQKKRNMDMWNNPPDKPATQSRLPNFTGDWMCSAAHGDWDEFLFLLDVPEFTRKLAKARKWGVRHSEQKISMPTKQAIQIGNHQEKLEYTTNKAGLKARKKPGEEGEEALIDASFRNRAAMAETVTLQINDKPQTITYEGYSGEGILRWEGTKLVTRMQLDKVGPVSTTCHHLSALCVARPFVLGAWHDCLSQPSHLLLPCTVHHHACDGR